MAEKKKRRTLPARGVPAGAKAGVPDRQPLVVKEDFGENTFAGALEAVRDVLEKAGELPPAKPRKKG